MKNDPRRTLLIKRLRENSGRPDYGAPALVAILSLAGVRGHVLLDLRLTVSRLKLAPFCMGGNSIAVCASFPTSFWTNWKRQN